MKRITVETTDDFFEDLKNYAKRNGHTVKYVVHRALIAYIYDDLERRVAEVKFGGVNNE